MTRSARDCMERGDASEAPTGPFTGEPLPGGRSSGVRRAAKRSEAVTTPPPKVLDLVFDEGDEVPAPLRNDRPTIPAPISMEMLARQMKDDHDIVVEVEVEISLQDVPFLKKMPGDQEVDHVVGFLLSHIDGQSSCEMLLDVSAMPVERVMQELELLWKKGFIGFG